MTPRDIVILGSTGSVGTQALEIVARNPDLFRVVGLGAGGGNVSALAEQVVRFGVEVVAVATTDVVTQLRAEIIAAAAHGKPQGAHWQGPTIVAGAQAMAELASWPADIVLNAVVGSVGLAPTLAALRAGRTLALANKESLVAGGPLVRAAIRRPDQIVPVDSEHSALAQCLRGGRRDEVRRLVLTASGGAFRDRRRHELVDVTPEQALAHPTWDMGPVVTINAATMVNKALEVIEAHELFGVAYDDIDVMIHPQSMIHSMVEFRDGSTLAQCSPPDMRLPIALGLGWPHRVAGATAPIDWTQAHTWQLRPLDDELFPAVRLAKQAGRAGCCQPAIFNAANEECVASFVAGRLPFLGIVETLARVLDESPEFEEPGTVEDIVAAETWARSRARQIIEAGITAETVTQ